MTLVETMIAIMILAIGLTTVFTSLVNARRGNQVAEDQALAHQGIQAQIETYQGIPFATLRSSFRGARFAVGALTPTDGHPSVGTITGAWNPDPAKLAPEANRVPGSPGSAERVPLRFRCEWSEGGSAMSAEVVYVFTQRGM